MASRDVIADAIARPIDWGRFEELAYALLVADDLPRLRKIGGGNDRGIDSQEESFYNGERTIPTIVQVTSQRTQKTKVRDTIKKLNKNKIDCRNLILLTRHPVSSELRRELIQEAEREGITLDIRDDQYLIGQLSKPKSPMFARFFGSTEEQLNELLARPDPLQVADSKVKHAMLVSLGAFVLSPRGRLARSTLFERTVLAALAANDGKAPIASLIQVLRSLSPEEVIDGTRVSAAIQALEKTGSCKRVGDEVLCVSGELEKFVRANQLAERGYRALLDSVVTASKRGRTLDDAHLGYIERNLRRALLVLLRMAGPLQDAESLAKAAQSDSHELKKIISRDLAPDLARTVLAAFSSFVQESEGAALLAPLVRSYSALAIRNMDPYGRRWQQAVLSRSCLALDTDALLLLLIKELPEHPAFFGALQALKKEGIEIVVPDHVLDEAVGHVQRADTTFRRFADRLLRLPEAVVDAKVWHAVVRGYYYAAKNGFQGSPDAYWNGYYDPSRPKQYIESILNQRLSALRHMELAAVVPEGAEADCVNIESAVLEIREHSRLKAEFRQRDDMSQRVRADVRMILNLAVKQDDSVAAPPKGYLVSEDRAFFIIEASQNWGDRPKVTIRTRVAPQLASFVCASQVDDDLLVRLLFEPVIVAAADQMTKEISFLASIGVDLKNVPLERLDWDLRHQLQDQLTTLEAASLSEEPNAEQLAAEATLVTAKRAAEVGYQLTGPVSTLVNSYDEALQVAESERTRSADLEKKLYALAEAARGTTKKGRRRINRVLQELGIQLPSIGAPSDTEEEEA